MWGCAGHRVVLGHEIDQSILDACTMKITILHNYYAPF